MKIRTLRSYKLTNLVSLDDVHSVVIVHSHYGTSLCLACKVASDVDRLLDMGLRNYGAGASTVIFIPMSNVFTYRYPVGVAIPQWDWQYIRIRYCTTEHHQTFVKAHLTKRLSDWSRR